MFISYARNFALVILVAFVAAVLFCVGGVSAMNMDKPMNECATQQSQIALCNIDPQGHLVWKNFLPVTPQKALDLLLTSLLLAVGFFVSRSLLNVPSLFGQYFRTKIRKGFFIIDPIRHALSRGIIQPQIYELA